MRKNNFFLCENDILVFLLILFSISPAFTQQHKEAFGSGYEFVSNGKVSGNIFQRIYQLINPKLKKLEFSQNLLIGAQRNLQYLKQISDNKNIITDVTHFFR